MAQSADLIVTAHIHLEIADGADVSEQMMEVTRRVERVLIDSAAPQKLDTDKTRVSIGKVIGAGIPNR